MQAVQVSFQSEALDEAVAMILTPFALSTA